jgi:hypothetical protein
VARHSIQRHVCVCAPLIAGMQPGNICMTSQPLCCRARPAAACAAIGGQGRIREAPASVYAGPQRRLAGRCCFGQSAKGPGPALPGGGGPVQVCLLIGALLQPS